MLRKLRRIASPRKFLIYVILFSFGILLYFYHDLQPSDHKIHSMDVLSPYECSHNYKDSPAVKKSYQSSTTNAQTRQRVLLFLHKEKGQVARSIVLLLESLRFKFHYQIGNVGSLPVLTDDNKGRYATIIFEDLSAYLELNPWNREVIDKYCRNYNVGIIYFISSNPSQGFLKAGNMPLRYTSGVKLTNYELNPDAVLLRIARPGQIWKKCVEDDWKIFELGHSTYQAVSYALALDVSECKGKSSRIERKVHNRAVFGAYPAEQNADKFIDYVIPVVQDTGEWDGIKRVFFGGGLRFWLHKVLMLDAISYTSDNRLSSPLERYVQIDIDDVFVGPTGIRMNADDVKALVSFQDEVRKTIHGFTFHLGFSGKFIYRGNEQESEGDRLFLKVQHNFAWFPHMWSHMQAHFFKDVTALCQYMDLNYKFAQRHHFNVSSQYAVSPHHAGVFPVHEQLYDCWKEVWNISYTSTEEYPHLRPDYRRRGFMHKGIKVLPRQTCGLFTHTIILKLYPGGPNALLGNIEGGALFQSFLYNQFNIFMTHMSNYGSDRLSLYTFDRVFKFVRCWTNLELLYIEPRKMAEKYFQLYPEELDPIWLNPCSDKRHLEIWSQEKNCNQLPDFVVVGPQKTGTTALYFYLNMHPAVQSNKRSSITFEEVQFFSGKNYYKGLDWYMNHFPMRENDTVVFEKSATYFDQEIVAKRLSALLPKAPVVVILIDPGKRAYSWYQHMRAHDDKTALAYSFDEVITASRKTSSSVVISLQRRCLDPGFYVDHIKKWLEYVKPSNIVIVDGERLKSDPISVMNELQIDLRFKKKIDYNGKLAFDKKKGFFCQLLKSGKTKCLGLSKGRKYPDMDKKSEEFLTNYYSEANVKLARLLKSMKKRIPDWLNWATEKNIQR